MLEAAYANGLEDLATELRLHLNVKLGPNFPITPDETERYFVLIARRIFQNKKRHAAFLKFAAPEIEALFLPSWDCQPYDRVSPNASVSAQRMTTLARLARSRGALERPASPGEAFCRPGPARGTPRFFEAAALELRDSNFKPPP